MTPEEYQAILKRIEDAYQTAIAHAEVLRHEQRLALETIWSLIGNEAPATTGRVVRAKTAATANGDAPTSQRQRIRRIIDGLTSNVDSAVVRRRYGEIYPDDHQPESSTVMKIIRELAARGWLRVISEPGFQTPATFEKTENYGKEN